MTTALAELRRWPPRLLATAALLAATGCASVTPIGQLLANPGQYDGKTVNVKGQVQESSGALGLGAYQLKDATGQLTVLTETGGPPPKGSTIGVKGKFQSLFTLGDKGLAVLHEESRSVP
jgi:hypothetical protein